MEPDGRRLEDGWFAGVVAGVRGAGVLDDEVASRVLTVLSQHRYSAPKRIIILSFTSYRSFVI